jgi:uncharacterized small protein (DUF1192 family)
MDTGDLRIDLVVGQVASATVVTGRRLPSWAVSSIASLVASIDERLAALQGEIARLQQSRAARVPSMTRATAAGRHAT